MRLWRFKQTLTERRQKVHLEKPFLWFPLVEFDLKRSFPTMLCSSLTYNAKEIQMLLKEEMDDNNKMQTVEWVVIDPASFTGNIP